MYVAGLSRTFSPRVSRWQGKWKGRSLRSSESEYPALSAPHADSSTASMTINSGSLNPVLSPYQCNPEDTTRPLLSRFRKRGLWLK